MTSRTPLTAHTLVKTYGSAGTGTTALAGVDLSIAPGESVAIMGPSGSGKTTLLHCLAGVLPATSGQVVWAGQDLSSMSERARTGLRRTDFGFVFQSGQLLPELPADENAALPLMLAGTPRAQATDTARRWLAYLGLGGMESRRPGELSGGQAQRVAIARALVGSPGVVFADEPTGALDQQTGHEVLGVLTEATRATGAALVIVTHDPGVARWCSRTVHMRDGRIVSEDRTPAAQPATPPTQPAAPATQSAPQAAPAQPGAPVAPGPWPAPPPAPTAPYGPNGTSAVGGTNLPDGVTVVPR
ncbi:ABC transporter ATP-binding protein [Occultella gossypii]|uniref:ABC transporter ATP-binding protein n=1 Tax=Occultella gossypii TaxID=2800820 RepID=A0ABS7SDQ5_9MICO|nr:ABC transporter ATP-binding protein [Occultella gossypii]MBZ2198192.1 ABC transporter ATP-binding protein [Occultella gossypii]